MICVYARVSVITIENLNVIVDNVIVDNVMYFTSYASHPVCLLTHPRVREVALLSPQINLFQIPVCGCHPPHPPPTIPPVIDFPAAEWPLPPV